MEARKKSFVAVLCLIGFASFAIGAHAQKGEDVYASKSKGPIRAVDMKPLGKEVSTEIIADESSGLPNAFIAYQRVPGGVKGPAMHTSIADESYFVISGQLSVQIGTDKFVAKPDTLVLIPAGTPYQIWNDGSETEVNVNVIAPVPDGAAYASLTKPAAATKVDNAAQWVRPGKDMPEATLGDGLNAQWLARNDNNSHHMAIHLDKEKVGQGGPAMHFHHFEQSYFVMNGTMQFAYGDRKYTAGPNTFMMIPHGVVHRNWNDGPGVEQNLIILLNQEPGKDGGDVMVDVKGTRGTLTPGGGASPNF